MSVEAFALACGFLLALSLQAAWNVHLSSKVERLQAEVERLAKLVLLS